MVPRVTPAQYVEEAVADLLSGRRTVRQIAEDARRDFLNREQFRSLADALLDSEHPEAREAGRVLDAVDSVWTEETTTDYLRGTRILAGDGCTCTDVRSVDRTCPLRDDSGHAALVARRWVDALLRGATP